MHFVYSPSPLGLAAFQVFSGHMGLVATMLGRTTDPESGLAGFPQTREGWCACPRWRGGSRQKWGLKQCALYALAGSSGSFPHWLYTRTQSQESYSRKCFLLPHFCASDSNFESLLQPILLSAPTPTLLHLRDFGVEGENHAGTEMGRGVEDERRKRLEN